MTRSYRSCTMGVLAGALCTVTSALGATYYVDNANPSCSDNGPGSQATPFCKIQPGITASVSGNTVIVNPGTYTGSGNRDLDYGGRNITVQSAGGPLVTIIDCQGSSQSPHRGFYFHSSETSAAKVQGFTIRNGDVTALAPPTGSPNGGGIYCWHSSSPTIEDCIIENCVAASGGGIGAEMGSGGVPAPIITGCKIVDNHAAGGNGGGIWGGSVGELKLLGCTIEGNRCSVSSPGTDCNDLEEGGDMQLSGWGGGMYIYRVAGNSPPNVRSTHIICNHATCGGGGTAVQANGQLPLATILSQCLIVGNCAGYKGGGIAVTDLGASLDIANCDLVLNESGKWGGALYVGRSTQTRLMNTKVRNNGSYEGAGILVRGFTRIVKVTNSDVVQNRGDSTFATAIYPGVSARTDFDPVLQQSVSPQDVSIDNSVVWDNVAPPGAGEAQISGGTVNVRHSNQPYADSGHPWTGIWLSNITTDPKLSRELKPQYSTAQGLFSSGIDAGRYVVLNDLVLEDFADLDNNGVTTTQITPYDFDIAIAGIRFRDNSSVSDCPQSGATCGSAPVADMGAYEHMPWGVFGQNDPPRLNRYLILPVNFPAGEQRAIRVTSGAWEYPLWVGPVPVGGSIRRLLDQEYFEAFGNSEVRVADSEVYPSAGGVNISYDVQTTKDGAAYEHIVTLFTPRWGDVNNDTLVNNADIIGMLNGIIGNYGPIGNVNPTRKETVDIRGPGMVGAPNVPDFVINNLDLVFELNAFTGQLYPFGTEPPPCCSVCCPDDCCSEEGMGGSMAMGAAAEGMETSDISNQELIDSMVLYFAAIESGVDSDSEFIPDVVEGLASVCNSTLNEDERSALAAALANPQLEASTLASSSAAETFVSLLDK